MSKDRKRRLFKYTKILSYGHYLFDFELQKRKKRKLPQERVYTRCELEKKKRNAAKQQDEI